MMFWQHGAWKIVLHILSMLLVLACVLFVKVSSSAKREFALGEEAYKGGGYKEAITHYERAIKWYTPFSRSVRLAVERLWEIGNAAEDQTDFNLALEAYRSLRSSLYAIRSFYLPFKAWIPRSEAKIASLMARTSHAEGQGAEKLQRDTTRFTQILQRKKAPQMGGTVLVVIGFLGWIGASIGFIWCMCAHNSMKIWRQGLLWGSCITGFFAMWIVGMLLA
jgi:tetratricopeptide (TPR) repeat protein